jgi:hypothetical protein
MYNSDLPARAELPSSRQLLRSTLLAAVSAAVILVAIVLPAEYAIDPTGAGRILGMTQMGEVKQQLAREAASDAAAAAAARAPQVPGPVAPPAAAAVAAAAQPSEAPSAAATPTVEWRDEIAFTLRPGEGTEIKLRMNEGATAHFQWTVEAGVVNYDTHGDAPGRAISYEKGRGVAADEGVLQAAFTGHHGWFWRNRGAAEVRVVLRTRGDYDAIKR